MASSRRIPYRWWLWIVFVVALTVSAIRPTDWSDFVVEHVVTLVMLLVLWCLTRGRPLSNLASTTLFIYLLFHVVGAHYTYTQVPYDRWSQAILGTSVSEIFGWQRNHFDRLVHFLWGFLLLAPMREIVGRRMGLTPGRASVVAIAFLATLSAAYEILEWLFTIVMSPEAAATYNGQQGDLFDAQKDAGLALAGSIIMAGLLQLGDRSAQSTKPRR